MPGVGYRGDVEVEIFNAEIWAALPEQVVATLARRHVELVAGHLAPDRGPTRDRA